MLICILRAIDMDLSLLQIFKVREASKPYYVMLGVFFSLHRLGNAFVLQGQNSKKLEGSMCCAVLCFQELA